MLDPMLSAIINSKKILPKKVAMGQGLKKLWRNSYIYRTINKNKLWWNLCQSLEFLQISHCYFFDNFEKICLQKSSIISLPLGRFSINTIAFSAKVMAQISSEIGNEASMNDEAIISKNFPIAIVTDFITCHLHFADQRAELDDAEEDFLLRKYEDFATKQVLLNK
jgi:hypothetical protein